MSLIREILELNEEEVREFLLKNESYFSLELPGYIDFSGLLINISSKLVGKNIKDLTKKNENGKPDWSSNYENVNYKFLHNKDGKYDWRPFEIIHPVLYVSLVNLISKKENWILIKDRLNSIRSKSKVTCISLPIISDTEGQDKADQIKKWWTEIEQKSLILGVDYEYLFHTDISDCYSSIYTHSIPWALHEKIKAKAGKNDKNLLGNQIDNIMVGMSYGQTNGIPQGSILMDFIAEIVLFYGDELISEKLEKIKENYRILRYRDDYRIFTNSVETGNEIVKIISEVLSELGLKLHSLKTKYSNNIIQNSVKEDKIKWLESGKNINNLQKQLLLLHKFSLEYSNSGTLVKQLVKLDKKIQERKNYRDENLEVLISILVDIALRNTKTYPQVISILSKFFPKIDEKKREVVIQKVLSKLKKIPNTGHFEIWLQRAIHKYAVKIEFKEKICKIISGGSASLWENNWIQDEEIIKILDEMDIVDRKLLDEMDSIIDNKEIALFKDY